MPELTMKEVFNQCQKGLQHHNKMLKLIRTMYTAMDLEVFWKEFLHLIKYSIIVYKREPAVERTIEFICKFVSAPEMPKTASQPSENEGEDKQEEDDIEDNPILNKMFEFLLEFHSACDRGVRFRCCQMINKLLNNLSQDAQIDDELYDRIYTCMLERMRDKVHVVRKHSVLAISRLQDPNDENCPVIKAYLYLMSCDPNPEVRRVVLGVIAPSTRTLPYILERTRDVNEGVRQVAYCVLAEKVNIKSLSIAQRLQLLQDGLNDRTASVKDVCCKKLLQAWLRTFSGNILELLKSLDVENSTEICEQVLETMFKQSQVADLVANFNLLDDNYLVTVAELDCESSMYWRVLLKYIKSLGSQYEEVLETILPNCLLYANYLRQYIDTNKDCQDIEKQFEIDFVLQQLLMLINSMDITDEAGRKCLERILHDMLVSEKINSGLVKHILPQLECIKTVPEALVTFIAETISEIKEPITTIEQKMGKDEQRQMDVKIAGIRVKINQLREEMEECVQKQEFAKAAELKVVIGQLDAEKSQLLDSTQPVVEEIRIEKNDPATILKCISIICEMLKILRLKTMSPTLQMMLETQIVPGVQNEDESVRNEAVTALALCCHLKQDLVMIYLPLLMQVSQVDTEEVRCSALRCLFDLVHLFGTDILKESDKPDSDGTLTETVEATTQNDDSTTDIFDDEETTKSSDVAEPPINVAAKLVAILSAFLDSESVELRTIASEGLAKLMLSGRLVSSKILSHLLLLWCNPLTEDDHHLRQCLGAFFPIFSFAARCNQEISEESFMITLKTLMNAPTSSPLSDVDICKVSDILVQLVNTRRLAIYMNTETSSMDNPGHDNICIKVCNEILTNPDSFNLKYWIRILNQLDVSKDNEQNIKTVIALCEEMLQVVKDKNCIKSLSKFLDSVSEYSKIEEPVSEGSPSAADTTVNQTLNQTVNDVTINNLSIALNETCISPDENKVSAKPKRKSTKTPAATKTLTVTSIKAKSTGRRPNRKTADTDREQENTKSRTKSTSKISKNLETFLQEDESPPKRSTRSALNEVSN